MPINTSTAAAMSGLVNLKAFSFTMRYVQFQQTYVDRYCTRQAREPTNAQRKREREAFRRARSIDLDLSPALLVLVAHELDLLFVHRHALIDADCEWLRVRFRILDSHVDFELAEDGTAEALGELRLAAVGT